MKKTLLIIAAVLLICGGVALIFVNKNYDSENNDAQQWQGEQINSSEDKQYQNPLTGEYSDEDLSNNRPVAVVVDNDTQDSVSGLSEADIVYEIPVEDGTTQTVAIYLNYENIPDVGPVGSLQEYADSLIEPLSAAVVHSGGSDAGYKAIKSTGFPEVDEMAQAAAFENNGYTSSELLLPILNENDMKFEQSITMPFLFSNKKASFEGEATQLKVSFSENSTAEFTYNKDLEMYQKSQSGKTQSDGNTGQPLQVKNVLVLYASVSFDGSGNVSVDYSQGGMGVYACEGEYSNIRWNKDSATEPFSLLNSDGDALTLQPGKTWVCILPQENKSDTSIFS